MPLPYSAAELAYAHADDTDNSLVPGFPARKIVGLASSIPMAADIFASLPCCLLSQFSAPDNLTKNVAFFSKLLGSFMVTHDRKILYRRGDGCADCITEGDLGKQNPTGPIHGWFQFMCDNIGATSVVM